MAPMIAKPSATCRLAMIQVIAEGNDHVLHHLPARGAKDAGIGDEIAVDARTPWKALKNTTKNTSTAASSTFDGRPRPSHITKIEPSTMRGSALTILM